MNVAVHAELTADAERIVVVGAGPVEGLPYLAKQLEQMTPLIKPTEPKGGLFLPASWAAVVQLSATYGPHYVPGPQLHAWTLDQVATRTRDARTAALTISIPEGLTPRPYQIEGAFEIARTGRALVFDEPRTGKTITTILGLAQMPAPLPILIICPASVVDPWVDRLREWVPAWRTVAWRGSKRTRLLGQADVYVTSYDLTWRDATDTKPRNSPLIALGAQSVVIDECHFIKAPDASRTRAVRRLAHRAKGAMVALSGTPITHNPADLWTTLDCLDRNAWPARERWVNRYCQSGQVDYGQSITGLNKFTEPEFRMAILGQHRRVARADVMDQLPPKVYSIRTVELPEGYRKAYDQMESEMLAQLPDGQELSVMTVLAQLTRLSQLSCAAADVEVSTELDAQGEERIHTKVTLKAPSWKVDALIEVLDERPGERSVCFAVSRQLIVLAGEAATKAGLRVGYIMGGQAMRERTNTIAAFQAGELDLVCATVGAGGTGITLSAAGTLIFLQRPWSLVDSLQAEDRAEGDLSQTRGTEIVDIIAANTIDTRVRAVLREKAGQLSDLVQDPRIVAELLGGASVRQLRKVS